MAKFMITYFTRTYYRTVVEAPDEQAAYNYYTKQEKVNGKEKFQKGKEGYWELADVGQQNKLDDGFDDIMWSHPIITIDEEGSVVGE